MNRKESRAKHKNHYLDKIKEVYQETGSWDKVITGAIYSDTFEGNEEFIDYVEEVYQTKIKDAKHLQKLTGITEENLEGLEDIIFSAKYSKYIYALEDALERGANYKDLLKIKPKDYGLPESWEDKDKFCKDQYTAILFTIGLSFYINEPIGLFYFPSLRYIAQEIEAPYSVVMDAYNRFHKEELVKVKVDYNKLYEVKSKELETLEEKLRKEVIKYIGNKPKTWRADRLLEAINKSWTIEKAQLQEKNYINWFIVAFYETVSSEIKPRKKQAPEIKTMLKAWGDEFYKDFKDYVEEAKKIISQPKIIHN